MGSRIEVLVWTEGQGLPWHDVQVYGGDSILKAMWVAWRAHRRGAGCVTVKWRAR